MMVRTTYLRNAGREPTLVITALRTLLSFNQVAISGHANAIVMRETEDKVALAEKIIAIADVAVPGTPLAPPAASITIFPTGRFANPTDPERHATLQSQLQLKPLPLGAVELRGDSRGLFETLASRGGLRVMFDSRFVNQNEAALTLTNADLLTSLDTLSFLTGNFWQVVDPQTIKVGTDNPTVRREMEPIVTQQVDLARIAASADMTEVVAALRTILSMNPITTPPSAIVISDTADRIALAQRIIATLDIPSRRIKP
jgi:hypothetical protein